MTATDSFGVGIKSSWEVVHSKKSTWTAATLALKTKARCAMQGEERAA
jgi:hypothetical protein